MSKSLGNTIDVIEQLGKRGADILRLWAATQNYHDDVNCSEGLIAQSEDAYRKIRNTLRYCMGACSDFDPVHHSEDPSEHSLDLWMKMKLHELIRDVREAYDRYEFYKATRLLYEFCTVEASSVYFSAIKDRLYCESPNAVRRRATQTVVYDVLVTLVKLLAPILPHTCEEAWAHIPFRAASEPHSVHLAGMPEYDRETLRLAEDPVSEPGPAVRLARGRAPGRPATVWARLMQLRSIGLGKLETLRNAGVKNSMDAEAVFRIRQGDKATWQLVDTYRHELEDLLGVGFARLEAVAELPEGLTADVEVLDAREKYQRCARSWKRRPDVGKDADYPDLSVRDAFVMKELKGE
jgi:isoleucyl-tRNA synthetase